MSKQSLSKVYKLLSFLKRNTDANHPATQAGLRGLAGEDAGEIFGDKGTFTRRLNELADALNTQADGTLLPKGEWKIVFPGYRKEGPAKNGKIYYNQPVSDFELEFLLQQVDASSDFTSEEKKSLKKRLMDSLSSRYFTQHSSATDALIRQADLKNSADSFLFLEDRLSILRKHILKKQMLEITVSGTSAEQKRQTFRFSPYRIVQRDDTLWLIGNRHERPQKEHPWPKYTDVLTAINIACIDKLSTAHTPDDVYIHWASTQALLPGQSYTRHSFEKRISKARYPEQIRRNLERFDQFLPQLQFDHMKDIILPKK